MEIGSLFLLLALLILVVMFIARPLVDPEVVVISPEQERREHEMSTLLAEHDRILNALQELDFDHALGKIPEEDYPAQRARLLNRGAVVLRKLDEYDQASPEKDVEERIEAAIAERRLAATSRGEVDLKREPSPVMADIDDELEAQLAARRRARQDKSAGFCPQCGRPVQKSDRFCPKCGNPL
jgi:hypothetical protein